MSQVFVFHFVFIQIRKKLEGDAGLWSDNAAV